MDAGESNKRLSKTLTGDIERRILEWLCRRMPARVVPDMLTMTGLIGSIIAFMGYMLSSYHHDFLWLAIVGIVINWFGDSLDGSLARHRAIERARYGFFLDHMTDVLAIGLITIGLGLSSMASIEPAMMVLIGYYVVMVMSLTTCITTGVFRISYGGSGPTEIRLLLVICTLIALFVPVPSFVFLNRSLTLYDAFMVIVAIILCATAVSYSIATARALSRSDPPRH